jgi:hypothetical protein
MLMNDAPIQIRNPNVVRDIRALAELSGMALTDAVADAVHHRLAELGAEREARIAEKLRLVEATLVPIDAIPNTGPLLTDDDLYDDYGLPK